MIGDMVDPRKEFGRAVTEIAETDDRIVILSADSGKSSGFGDFMKNHPDRYYECGIEEQGVTGVAAGLAATGKIAVFCAIAPFVTCRNYEMFRNDLGYMNQNVKIVGRNCGFTYSDLGATHHSLEDFAIIRMIPGVTILAPQDPSEIRGAAKAMMDIDGPVYMRVGNPKIETLFEDKPFEIGKGTILSEGDDITIISTGSTTPAAIKAVESLASNGVSVRHIGMPTVWPVDEALVKESAEKTKKILVVEEHYRDGGLGTIVTETVSEMRDVIVKRHGVPKEYATTGTYEDLLELYELDEKGIEKKAMELVSQ